MGFSPVCRHIIVFWSWWAMVIPALGQGSVGLHAPIDNPRSLDDLCTKVVMSYVGDSTVEAFLQIVVISDSAYQKLAEFATPAFTLGQDLMFGKNLPGPYRIQFFDTNWEAQLKELESFPEGAYTICYNLVGQQTYHILANRCMPYTRSSSISTASDTVNKKDKALPLVSFRGNARITSQYASSGLYGQIAPASFVRAELEPQLLIAGVPIQTRIVLTSEHDRLHYDINRVSINFDSRQYLALLQQRLLEKVADTNRIHALDVLEQRQQAGKIAQLESTFDAEQYLKDQDDLMQLEQDTTLPDELKAKRLAQLRQKISKQDSIKTQIEQYYNKAEQIRQFENVKEDPEQLKQQLKDPKQLKKALASQGMLSKATQLLLSVKRFSIGTNYPIYSPLTLNGLGINGLDMELQPGLWHLSVAVGTTTRFSNSFNPFISNGRQRVLAMRTGIGTKEGNHLFIGISSFKDMKGSSTNVDRNHLSRNNSVWDIEARLALSKALFVEGQVARSRLSFLSEADDLNTSALPGRLGLDFEDRVNNTAYRLGVSGELPEVKTKIRAEGRYVGPGYYTIGVPGLRSDNLLYETSAEQPLLKNKITLGATYRHNEDNLDPFKRYKTLVRSYGLNAAFRFRSYPTLQVSYLPLYQESQSDDPALFYRNEAQVFSVSSSWTKAKRTWSSTAQLTYSLQAYSSHSGQGNYEVHYWTLNEVLNIGRSLSFLTILNVIQHHHADSANKFRTFHVDQSCSYQINTRWQVSGGATFAQDQSQGLQNGYYIGAGANLGRWGILNLNAQYNTFRQFFPRFPVNEQWLGQLTIVKSW